MTGIGIKTGNGKEDSGKEAKMRCPNLCKYEKGEPTYMTLEGDSQFCPICKVRVKMEVEFDKNLSGKARPAGTMRLLAPDERNS